MTRRNPPTTGLEHCGNSPRMALTAELLVAWAAADESVLAPWCADDIIQFSAGTGSRHQGSSNVLRSFRAPGAVTHLAVHGILSHGKAAACDGTATLADGTLIDFAHHLTFASAGKQAKIREIRTFQVARRA